MTCTCRASISASTIAGRKIRVADVADLALLDQIVERAQRLLNRRQRIVVVRLVEIDQSVLTRVRLASTANMM